MNKILQFPVNPKVAHLGKIRCELQVVLNDFAKAQTLEERDRLATRFLELESEIGEAEISIRTTLFVPNRRADNYMFLKNNFKVTIKNEVTFKPFNYIPPDQTPEE